jgi:hypothetical protein
MDVTMKLRAACGHDSRSVDGCTNCEAADMIDAFRAGVLHSGNRLTAARVLIEECQAALYVEMTEGWDIDPPLHHVKQAHDRCTAWLVA